MPDIGGPVAKRPVHFFFILDGSGSMTGQKIAALNEAIAEAIPHMRSVAESNPMGELFVRALRFSDGAQWIVPSPTPVEDFEWHPIHADGVTDMGRALEMVAAELDVARLGDRAYPPVLVLVSDGQPTDDFTKGLKALTDKPWGKKSIRIAIAIGHDADHDVLERFIGNPEMPVLQANNPEQLVSRIRWASTVVTQASMRPASQVAGSTGAGYVPIPTPPPLVGQAISADDVW